MQGRKKNLRKWRLEKESGVRIGILLSFIRAEKNCKLRPKGDWEKCGEKEKIGGIESYTTI
jgi:hypothetical protein